MRVLVLGSTGLLGHSLVPYLRDCGHEVIENISTSKSDRVDLTNYNLVKQYLDLVAPGCIVNLAALTNVDECERHPKIAYALNIKIVDNLARWLTNNGDCHFVHISTDQVYDGQGPNHEDNVNLSNYYAYSKYASELIANTVSSTILRTNFFGKSMCPGRNSFSDWIVNSLTDDLPITVFDDVLFSPLSFMKLVEMIEYVMIKRRQGIFNLGSTGGISKAEFAFKLAETLNLSTTSMKRGLCTDVNLFAYRPKDMIMNSSRFEAAYNIKLPHIDDEIQSMRLVYDANT